MTGRISARSKQRYIPTDEPNDEQDSGWQFFAGIDPAIIKYIDNPAGSRFVRKSSAEFEEDRNQPAFMEKWKGDQQ